MRLNVIDAAGETVTIVVVGPATLVNKSGVIAGITTVMAANADRAGWYFQNNGAANMTINEMGDDPTADNGFVLVPGASFPPPGYPVTTTAIKVIGTAGQKFTAREY